MIKTTYSHFRIDQNLKLKAKKLRVPISKTCRQAIEKEVKKRERSKAA